MDRDREVTLGAQRVRTDQLLDELAEMQAAAESLQERISIDRPVADEPGAPAASPRLSLPTYEDVIELNAQFLNGHGTQITSLDQFLTVREIDILESLDPLGRERWAPSDFVAVGLAGAIGVAATIWDDQVDTAVRQGLAALKKTETMKRWEREARGLPIDYTGKDFGGPGHRVRSAGHDVGRPFEALRQIRSGTFEGWKWDDGVRIARVEPGYGPIDSSAEALVLWLKHLLADFVTATSLPVPWWSRLYEIDSRDLRTLAHGLYNPADGFGINLRAMTLSKVAPVLTTELIVRTKLWIETYRESGEVTLSPTGAMKRDEMLFAGHAVTGAAALARVVYVCYATSSPLGLRHFNAFSLGRAGWLGWRLAAERRRRRAERDPQWDELIATDRLPWEVDELATLEQSVLV